jgi:beta-lactam-binding protein with PASTA domain
VPETANAAAGSVVSDTTRDSGGVPPVAPSRIEPPPEAEPRPPVTFDLSQPINEEKRQRGTATVPDVRGLPLRTAARVLHTAGFRVQVIGGHGGATRPPAGAEASAGSLVRLQRP